MCNECTEGVKQMSFDLSLQLNQDNGGQSGVRIDPITKVQAINTCVLPNAQPKALSFTSRAGYNSCYELIKKFYLKYDRIK